MVVCGGGRGGGGGGVAGLSLLWHAYTALYLYAGCGENRGRDLRCAIGTHRVAKLSRDKCAITCDRMRCLCSCTYHAWLLSVRDIRSRANTLYFFYEFCVTGAYTARAYGDTKQQRWCRQIASKLIATAIKRCTAVLNLVDKVPTRCKRNEKPKQNIALSRQLACSMT